MGKSRRIWRWINKCRRNKRRRKNKNSWIKEEAVSKRRT